MMIFVLLSCSGSSGSKDANFFQTAFTAVHHLGGQSYVVIFDQPVDAVFGIAVIRDPMGGEGTELSYLDANLKVIGTSEITFREWVQE